MHLHYICLSIVVLMITTHLHAALAPKKPDASLLHFHTEKHISSFAKTMAATAGFMVGMAEQTAVFKYFLVLSSSSEDIIKPFVLMAGNWIVSAGAAFYMKESCEGRISKLSDSDKKASAAKIVADYMYRQGRIRAVQIPEMETAYLQARDGVAVKDGASLRAYHNTLMEKAVMSTFFWRGFAAAVLGGPLTGIVGCYLMHHAGIMHAPLRL